MKRQEVEITIGRDNEGRRYLNFPGVSHPIYVLDIIKGTVGTYQLEALIDWFDLFLEKKN
jgi:hypothetical protein